MKKHRTQISIYSPKYVAKINQDLTEALYVHEGNL